MNTNVVVAGLVAVVVVGGIFLAMQPDDLSVTEKDNQAMIQKNQDAMEQNKNNNNSVTKEENGAGVMVGGAAMLPSRDIVDNAVLASNVTTLVAAVKAADLVETLKGDGPFTVFAPNNASFDKLPAGTVDTLLKPENKDKLTNILTYHVVAGRYTSVDLSDGQKLKTVQGKEITINKNSAGKITVNGNAMVETADIISSNGVTFIINMVLMP